MGSCNTSTNCNPCGPDFNAINQLATRAGAYARQANTSAVDAANSAQDAQNAWLEFNALYLGAFAVAPSVDNEGNPLQEGALYWNSVSNELFAWNGSTWVATNFNEFTPFLATGTTTPRNLVTREADVVNVKDFGAVGDEVADDTAAIQAAFNFANSQNGGLVFFPKGTYLTGNQITIPSNLIMQGSGVGATKIKTTASIAFRNLGYTTTGAQNITIKDIEFDGNNVAGAFFQFGGVENINIENVYMYGIAPDGVTAAIGFTTDSNSVDCKDITITNSIISAPDYGVVFDSNNSASFSIKNITISNCLITTAWGSGISLNGNISEAAISDNVFQMPGNGISGTSASPNVGFGIKLLQGISETAAPANVAITGNVFNGQNGPRVNIIGVNTGNWAQHLSVTGNTFKYCNSAFTSRFAQTPGGPRTALGLLFSSNSITDCDFGAQADTSTDAEIQYVGNYIKDTVNGIKTVGRNASITSNKFVDIAEKGIELINPAEHCIISGNAFTNIGHEAIKITADGASGDTVTITGNAIFDSCIAADNTYNSIQLNNQQHCIVGNTIVNESATIKPIYLIGSTVGSNWKLISSNFMFGARLGYREIAGANDVYSGNIERGGIS
jgi:hypothetical protein